MFGVGPADAKIVFVGEQPGDREDKKGRPFVGPAGKVLDQALKAAGIVREAVYVTNLVKHFKFTTSAGAISSSLGSDKSKGKKRLHQRPNSREIRCCRPWFEAEWSFLENAQVLVCLGATAAKAIIGPNFRITSGRGAFVSSDYSEKTIATWHPSAILRTSEQEQRVVRLDQMIADLKVAISHTDEVHERLP